MERLQGLNKVDKISHFSDEMVNLVRCSSILELCYKYVFHNSLCFLHVVFFLSLKKYTLNKWFTYFWSSSPTNVWPLTLLRTMPLSCFIFATNHIVQPIPIKWGPFIFNTFFNSWLVLQLCNTTSHLLFTLKLSCYEMHFRFLIMNLMFSSIPLLNRKGK